MLTAMVAGPNPTYCETGGNTHQPNSPPLSSDRGSPSPEGEKPPPSQDSSALYTSSLSSSSSSLTSSSAVLPDGVPQSDHHPLHHQQQQQQQEYTPSPLPCSMSQQPQGPPPPYCPQEFIPGETFYPGPPPEYCQHHSMCGLQHGGVPGPATVRMVSTNSSPPIALPVQMPPGHVVQQIVDESGTLQHVILSAQPLTMPVCSYGPNGGQGPPQFYSPPPGPPPPQGYMASYPHGPPQQYPAVISPPLTQTSPPPSLSYQKGIDRGGGPPPGRHPEKNLRTKFYSPRHSVQGGSPAAAAAQHHHYSSASQSQHPHHFQSPHHGPLRGGSNNNNNSGSGGGGGGNSPMAYMGCPGSSFSSKNEASNMLKGEYCGDALNGDNVEQDERGVGGGGEVVLQEILSSVTELEVVDIEAFSAVFRWSPPSLAGVHLHGIPVSPEDFPLTYEVYVNNKFYHVVSEPQIFLGDLRPGTEYRVYIVCFCKEVRGYPTVKKVFTTRATPPDEPLQPRLADRKKNSLLIKWTPPWDNGAKISHYCLEVLGGQYECWTVVYKNRGREFSIGKLRPQTTYRFRLSATNDAGTSNYSQELMVSTSGLAPHPPDAPRLASAGVTSLRLAWHSRGGTDESFTLEMEDPFNDYGFRPVYNGPDTTHVCRHLRRSSSYRFRLCAHNANGKSPFSGTVSFTTAPETPRPPDPPIARGKTHSNKLFMSWLPPTDCGGASISSYVVQIDKGRGFETIYSGPELECDVSGLSPGTRYRVRCLAEGPGGQSGWSPEGQLETKAVVPGACKPPRLMGKPKANLLSLKWSHPEIDGGSPVNEFHLDMVTPDTDRRQVYLGRDTECTVASLLPGRAYMFLLQACNKIGAGPWSEPFEVVSGPGSPEPPKAPHVACKGAHVVVVSWDPPINNGARVDQYVVQMAESNCPNVESSETSSSCGDPDPNDLHFADVYKGSAPSAEVKSLSPATTYAFRVNAYNVAGGSPFSGTSLVTTPAAAPAPVAHITSTVEATSAVLRWTEPPSHGDPITSYKIDCGEKHFATDGPLLEFSLVDLQPLTSYKVRIQAVNSVGLSPLGPAHRFVTKALPPTPPQLELVKASYNALRLKWGDGRNPDLLKFSLQMECRNPHNDSMEFYQVYGGLSQAFKVSRLEENRSYRFRISASNEAGLGPDSDPVEFSTTKAPPPPLKAPRVTECDTVNGGGGGGSGGSSSCRVEWCSVRCPPSGGDDAIVYRLQLLQSGRDSDYSLVYKGDATEFTLTGLKPQTAYYVRVCGVRVSDGNELIAGSFSSPTLFNTRRKEGGDLSSPSDGGGPGKSSSAASFADLQKSQTKLVMRRLSWRRLSDHEKALLILAVFSLLAFVTAYVLSPVRIGATTTSTTTR